MNELWRAIRAEMLKLKRTLALWMVLIAPVVVVLLYLGSCLENYERFVGAGENMWDSFLNSIIVLWGLIMLPLFITLETALLGQMEHGPKQWKHIFALPVSRGSIYLAKMLVTTGMILVATLLLCGSMITAGLVARKLLPGMGFEYAVPWTKILRQPLLIFLLASLLIAIHTWVSQRWSSFTVAVGVGIVAVTISIVLGRSDVWGAIYPWSLPLNVLLFSEGAKIPQGLLESIPGAILVAALGGWQFVRRDVTE